MCRKAKPLEIKPRNNEGGGIFCNLTAILGPNYLLWIYSMVFTVNIHPGTDFSSCVRMQLHTGFYLNVDMFTCHNPNLQYNTGRD